MSSTQHDSYAADYDAQVRAHDCHIADLVLGLCFEHTRPGQSLLDVGTGSGLSAQLFARAGLEVSGMDYSPAMLEICKTKGFFADLQKHDLTVTPWPYPANHFDYLVACGVFHFIGELAGIFDEASRLLRPGGLFAFTTRFPSTDRQGEPFAHHQAGGFEIFSHSTDYIASLLKQSAFTRRKLQKCFIGDDLFLVWVAQESHQA